VNKFVVRDDLKAPEKLTFKVYTASGSLESSITFTIGSDVADAKRKLEWFMKQLYEFLETLKDDKPQETVQEGTEQ
jgi:hypothetical protein